MCRDIFCLFKILLSCKLAEASFSPLTNGLAEKIGIFDCKGQNTVAGIPIYRANALVFDQVKLAGTFNSRVQPGLPTLSISLRQLSRRMTKRNGKEKLMNLAHLFSMIKRSDNNNQEMCLKFFMLLDN
jgi:hypothetical protein